MYCKYCKYFVPDALRSMRGSCTKYNWRLSSLSFECEERLDEKLKNWKERGISLKKYY